jgi:O-antigen/teichoic acid export membrane protein
MGKGEKIFSVFLGGLVVIALATTLVGKGKQTPAVINSTGGAISNTLKAAQGG